MRAICLADDHFAANKPANEFNNFPPCLASLRGSRAPEDLTASQMPDILEDKRELKEQGLIQHDAGKILEQKGYKPHNKTKRKFKQRDFLLHARPNQETSENEREHWKCTCFKPQGE